MPSSCRRRIVSQAARRAAGRSRSSARRGRSAPGRRRAPAPGPGGAAGRRRGARASARLLLEPDDPQDLDGVTRSGVEAGPVADRLAAPRCGGTCRSSGARSRPARAAHASARRVQAQHRDDPAAAPPVALEDLDGRRLARAVGAEQAEDLAGRTSKSIPRTASNVAVGLAQVADEDGWRPCVHQRTMIAGARTRRPRGARERM